MSLSVPEQTVLLAAIQDLASRGLVAQLAGGSRAVLTGAGRWCAAKGPDGDSKPVAGQDGAGVASGGEAASEGHCGPSTGASR